MKKQFQYIFFFRRFFRVNDFIIKFKKFERCASYADKQRKNHLLHTSEMGFGFVNINGRCCKPEEQQRIVERQRVKKKRKKKLLLEY